MNFHRPGQRHFQSEGCEEKEESGYQSHLGRRAFVQMLGTGILASTTAGVSLAQHFSEPEPELEALLDGLGHGSGHSDKYAFYTLKKGEALYTAVVVRFTDYRYHADILKACQLIAQYNDIPDMHDIDAGMKIYIPEEILSDRFKKRGNLDRERYEETLIEMKRLRGTQGRSKDLSDVVVILDSGHGGADTGAKHVPSKLYEDEINYDIVCRIRESLRKSTGATVYVTGIDRSSAYKISSAKHFSHDRDEELLTSPRYPNALKSSVSANLRWMLVNSIFQKERDQGRDSSKIVFTSIHTDSLYNEQLRGAMIYVPGAKYRKDLEVCRDSIYMKYLEGRNFNRFTSTPSERQRDEALSRNFATTLLEELGKKRVKRHDASDPIRAVIRRSRTKAYVPAVLRCNKVPTKILLETANMNNATDRKRLQDPYWRQLVADAYVNALKSYYG